MADLADDIVRLELAEDYHGMSAAIGRGVGQPDQLIFATYQLLIQSRYKGAYILAKTMGSAALANPVLSLALSIGGVLFNDKDDEAAGCKALGAATNQLSPDQQGSIYAGIVSKVVPNLVNHSFLQNDTATLIRLLDILKASTPPLREIFDLSDPVPALSLDDMRRRGRERLKLIPLPVPPQDAPKPDRTVVVAIREFFLGAADPKKSRLCDMGPRIEAAMNAYGWHAHYYGMYFQNPQQDYIDIGAMCRQMKADILVLDDNWILHVPSRKWRMDMLAQLRADMPDIKIVSVYFDPWMLPAADLAEASSIVDILWTPFPSLPAWNLPAFKNKVSVAPMPLGFAYDRPFTPLEPRMTFAGGVMGYNWHRALWLGASLHKNLPVERKLSSHKPDGLPALESYRHYMDRLAEAGCSLNFSMRDDMQRITTGRTFETILSGALLVEEWSPDIAHYLLPGEHYLSFENFRELRSIAAFLKQHPDQAGEVRKRGYAFAREQYGDHRLIASIDNFLYNVERARPSVPPISTGPTAPMSAPIEASKPNDEKKSADFTHNPLPHQMTYMQGGEPVITIGRFSYINRLATMTVDNRSRIVIGSFSSIGWDVLFLLRSNHHAEWVTTYPIDWFPWNPSVPKPVDPHAKQRDNVTVGSDVWIGKGVTVLPGITIGDGAIIAADAVVTKDVRPYAIIAGNPGREIKRRFDDETVDYLMDIKWWDQPNEFIIKHSAVICSGDFDALKRILPPSSTAARKRSG